MSHKGRITPERRDLLAEIEGYAAAWGDPPTLRDLAKGGEIGGIRNRVERLAREGMTAYLPGIPRRIVLTEKARLALKGAP